jgi:hypothetical protein
LVLGGRPLKCLQPRPLRLLVVDAAGGQERHYRLRGGHRLGLEQVTGGGSWKSRAPPASLRRVLGSIGLRLRRPFTAQLTEGSG